jgi:argininosuccinate synthase
MITLDKDTKHMKSKLAVDFADLVYNGKWFTPLREALQAFAVDTQKYVTGTVKLKLYKGNIITSSVTSPCTLYSENLVTFNDSDYDQKDSQGFINLWGLPTPSRRSGSRESCNSKQENRQCPSFRGHCVVNKTRDDT